MVLFRKYKLERSENFDEFLKALGKKLLRKLSVEIVTLICCILKSTFQNEQSTKIEIYKQQIDYITMIVTKLHVLCYLSMQTK